MRGAILYGEGDVRFEDRAEPKILAPTDAIIRIAATCVCGSDLWPYRGLQPSSGLTPMGYEYCGLVEEVGSAVKSVKPGQFVIGSFFASDNTCPHCQSVKAYGGVYLAGGSGLSIEGEPPKGRLVLIRWDGLDQLMK